MGAVPFLASIVFSPLVPIAMRYVNVRTLMIGSILSDFVFIVLMMLFDNIYVWYVCRFMMGVAGTLLFVVSETWINVIAEDHYRGRVLGLYTFVFSGTLGLSPLIIVFFGVEGNLPFLVASVIILLGIIPLYWTRDSNPDFPDGKVSDVLKFLILAPTLVAAATLMSFEEATLVTLLPVYAFRSGLTEANSALLLTVLAVGSMAAQPVVGRLADSMNRYHLLYLCALVMIVCILLLPLAINSSFISWPLMLLLGGSVAGIYTVALTIMGHRFSGSQLAAGNAAFGIMWGVSGTLAPGLAGVAMSIWDPNGLIVVMALSVVVFFAVATYRTISKAKESD